MLVLERMATTKRSPTKASSKSSKSKDTSGKAYQKTSRCWPGYVPVPGKSEHEEGSCRPEPASKNGGKTVNRETARKKQIGMGGKRAEQAKSKSPDAAERRSVSKAAKSHRGTKSSSAGGSSSRSKKMAAASGKPSSPRQRKSASAKS